MSEEKEKEKRTRTTVNISKKLWTDVRKEAYEKGEKVSDILEERLHEHKILREAILTPEQKKRLEEMRKKREGS